MALEPVPLSLFPSFPSLCLALCSFVLLVCTLGQCLFLMHHPPLVHSLARRVSFRLHAEPFKCAQVRSETKLIRIQTHLVMGPMMYRHAVGRIGLATKVFRCPGTTNNGKRCTGVCVCFFAPVRFKRIGNSKTTRKSDIL